MKEKIVNVIQNYLDAHESVKAYQPSAEKIADDILALEVEDMEKKCDYTDVCEHINQIRKTRHCDECREYRPATIADLIGDQ